jgi:hypothetical protein
MLAVRLELVKYMLNRFTKNTKRSGDREEALSARWPSVLVPVSRKCTYPLFPSPVCGRMFIQEWYTMAGLARALW